MDRKQHITIYIIMPIAVFLILIGLSFALSPPPVEQRMGMYDTQFTSLTETNCRGCHASGVDDTHHVLVGPDPNVGYQCTNCHPIQSNGSILVVHNCIQCHDNVFNGMTIRRPHHETQAALSGHCMTCHGSVVANVDDGHYISASPPSSMTPNTTYKTINLTSGRKWGGCESCHEQDLNASPFISLTNKTHHRLGNLSGFRNNDNSKCGLCHDLHNATYGSDSIRYCERCHSYDSLHNIQWDYPNTTTQSGYGHLGPNDCQGCHASYVAGSLYTTGSLAPGADYIVPTVYSLSTNKVLEGQSTTLRISGEDFITTIDNITKLSVVVISNNTNSYTLTPINISDHELIATVPPLNKGLYMIYAVKNGTFESNRKPVISAPPVIITSATKVNSDVIINGSGFGKYDPLYQNYINVTINGNAILPEQVTNWSGTLITVNNPTAAIGDMVTVNSVYGTNSTNIN
jgi:hypothetical protein